MKHDKNSISAVVAVRIIKCLPLTAAFIHGGAYSSEVFFVVNTALAPFVRKVCSILHHREKQSIAVPQMQFCEFDLHVL